MKEHTTADACIDVQIGSSTGLVDLKLIRTLLQLNEPCSASVQKHSAGKFCNCSAISTFVCSSKGSWCGRVPYLLHITLTQSGCVKCVFYVDLFAFLWLLVNYASVAHLHFQTPATAVVYDNDTYLLYSIFSKGQIVFTFLRTLCKIPPCS